MSAIYKYRKLLVRKSVLMKLRRKFDTRIEPHAFRESDFDISNPLAKEILTTGLEIF